MASSLGGGIAARLGVWQLGGALSAAAARRHGAHRARRSSASCHRRGGGGAAALARLASASSLSASRRRGARPARMSAASRRHRRIGVARGLISSAALIENISAGVSASSARLVWRNGGVMSASRRRRRLGIASAAAALGGGINATSYVKMRGIGAHRRRKHQCGCSASCSLIMRPRGWRQLIGGSALSRNKAKARQLGWLARISAIIRRGIGGGAASRRGGVTARRGAHHRSWHRRRRQRKYRICGGVGGGAAHQLALGGVIGGLGGVNKQARSNKLGVAAALAWLGVVGGVMKRVGSSARISSCAHNYQLKRLGWLMACRRRLGSSAAALVALLTLFSRPRRQRRRHQRIGVGGVFGILLARHRHRVGLGGAGVILAWRQYLGARKRRVGGGVNSSCGGNVGSFGAQINIGGS